MSDPSHPPLSPEPILGFPVSPLNQDQCVWQAAAWLRGQPTCRFIACANPYSLVTARADPAFAAALRSVDLLLPDGVGVVLASRILGGKLHERTTGSDLFRRLCGIMDELGDHKVFFLGTNDETLGSIRRHLAQDYPGITVAGALAPPYKDAFDEEEMRAMTQAVNDSGADVLWVGMTAPKQEKWIQAARGQLRVSLAVAIGAVFDYYAGRVPRPGPRYQRMGLEWFRRWVGEPKRLLRRNLVSPLFLWLILRERIRAGQRKARAR